MSRIQALDHESLRHLTAKQLRQVQRDVANHVAELEAKNAALARRVLELEQHASDLEEQVGSHWHKSNLAPTHADMGCTQDEYKLLPDCLRGFKTISSFDEVHSMCDELASRSQRVVEAPDDDEAIAALSSVVERHVEALDRVVVSRLDETGIVEQCDTAIATGMHDCREIYDVLWNRIERRTTDFETYLSIAKVVVDDVQARRVDDFAQRSDNPVDLFRDAARTKPMFDAFMTRFGFQNDDGDGKPDDEEEGSFSSEPSSIDVLSPKTTKMLPRWDLPGIPRSVLTPRVAHTMPRPYTQQTPLVCYTRQLSEPCDSPAGNRGLASDAYLRSRNLIVEDNSSQSGPLKTKPNQPFKVKIPPELKKISRICEKASLRADQPGSAARIFDVCRCMVEVSSMAHASLVLKLLHESDEIEMVRIKERFVRSPSPGGWRDCLVNFYLKDDAARHVVEVQIVHCEMIVARKNLSGHAIYNVVRNANEILERIGVGERDGRSVRIAKLRHTELESETSKLYSASYFRRIGVSLQELVAADCYSSSELRQDGGYSAEELRENGIPLSALLRAGFSARDLKAADARDPGAILAANYTRSEVFEAFDIELQADIDRAVLSHLYHATGCPSALTNWGDASQHIGNWHGVGVDDNGHVVSLHAARCDLSGTIPKTIGLLQYLQTLDLSHNPGLCGELPRELGHLHRLSCLNLSKCTVWLPGSGAKIPSVGLDPRRESRARCVFVAPTRLLKTTPLRAGWNNCLRS